MAARRAWHPPQTPKVGARQGADPRDRPGEGQVDYSWNLGGMQVDASRTDQPIEGELAPVEETQRALQRTRLSPKAMATLGSVLAFVGREILPRVASMLLAAWDRQNAFVPASSDVQTDVVQLPVGQPRALGGMGGGGNRHRHRARQNRG